MKVKRLVIVTGDEYDHVELFSEVPSWLKVNAPDEFIAVKLAHSQFTLIQR